MNERVNLCCSGSSHVTLRLVHPLYMPKHGNAQAWYPLSLPMRSILQVVLKRLQNAFPTLKLKEAWMDSWGKLTNPARMSVRTLPILMTVQCTKSKAWKTYSSVIGFPCIAICLHRLMLSTSFSNLDFF